MRYWFPLNPSKSKYEVVHEQKFKDLLSSTCQVSVERIVLDWNQRLWEAHVLFPLGVTFCHCIFFLFSRSKDENATIGISVHMWKTLLYAIYWFQMARAGAGGHQVNKFEQVSIWSHGGTLNKETYWHYWKHYLPATWFAGGKYHVNTY